MAERNPYLPRTDAAKLAWLTNFSAKFAGYGATLGFAPAEVTAVDDDLNMYKYTVGALDTFKTWLQNLAQFKGILAEAPIGTPISAFPTTPLLAAAPTAVDAGIFRRIGKTVQRIKGHPAYTTAIGEDLGIIGAEVVIDPTTLKPELKGALDGVRPLIKWKKSVADSLNIYVDRRDGQGFVFLVNDTIPDYIDTYPLAAGVNSAVWDYKARYRVGDDEVGVFSDTITITTTRNV